jgi:hypothetical protein
MRHVRGGWHFGGGGYTVFLALLIRWQIMGKEKALPQFGAFVKKIKEDTVKFW